MRKTNSVFLALLLSLLLILPVYASETSAEGNSGTEENGAEVTECQHTFGAWSAAAQGHSRTCSLCGAVESNAHSWDAGTVTTPATCTTAGVESFSCSVCGEKKTESITPTGHSYSSWQKADESLHKRVCSICGTEDSSAHSWDSGKVTTASNCLVPGEKTFTCAGCGAEKYEALPLADHAYGEWTGDEKTHSRTCDVCGKTESGEHKWDGGSVKIPATCQEEGVFVYICSRCGGALIEMIPKLTTHTYDNACDPECNVCGNRRDIQHSFSAVWMKNGREHWHACTLCGEKKDIGNHFPGPAATEEKAQICLTCGCVLTAKLNHTHKFSPNLSFDETGHFYACEGCEEREKFEAHSYDSACDSDCAICGFIRQTSHEYPDSYQQSDTEHWRICKVCGEESSRQQHLTSGKGKDGKGVFCTVCGYELPENPEHMHTFAVQWESDESDHWKQCQCGEEAEKGPHLWDKKNLDKTVVYRCSVCGRERMENTQKAEGTSVWWIAAVAGLLICAAGAGGLLWNLLKKPSGRYSR